MNILESHPPSISFALPHTHQKQEHLDDFSKFPAVMSVGEDPNHDDKVVSRKRSASDADLTTEEEEQSSHASNDAESRMVCADSRIQEFEAAYDALRRENAQLRDELNAVSTENNNLWQFLDSQQQAVQERNQALQLLLQQPGLIMQQQQHGPLLALPGAPVSLLNEAPNDVSMNHLPSSLHAPSHYIVQEQPSSQQQTTVLLLPPDSSQGQQSTYTALFPEGASVEAPPSNDAWPLPPACDLPAHRSQEQVLTRTFSSNSLSSCSSGVQATSRNARALFELKRELDQVQGELKEIHNVKSRLQNFCKQESVDGM